eukprot:jgi/Tetstr1/423183/TSEL_001304.t1
MAQTAHIPAFGQGLLETSAPLEARVLAGRGRGCVTTGAFRRGDTIAADKPMAAVHLGSSEKRVQACAHCFRYLGTLQSQFQQLAGRADPSSATSSRDASPYILPGLASSADGHLSRVHPCRNGCGDKYCTAGCEAAGFAGQHRLLCPAGSGRSAAAREALLELRALAHSDCEAFMLAAKLMAAAFSAKDIAAQRRLESQMHMLGVTAPWWELVVIPEDVPARKHAAYRSKLKAKAQQALSLTAAVLEPAAPPHLRYMMALDHFGLLLGAILQNSVCIELPSPVRQYLEAQLGRDQPEDIALLVPLAREVLQHHARLQQEEEDAEGISLDGDSGESEASSSEEGSSGAGGSEPGMPPDAPSSGTLSNDEAVDLLAAAIAVIPDVEASGVFPLISFLNHSCQANASIEFSGQDGLHAEIVATGDVASGDELYISYIDDDEMDLQERTQELREYQFVCDCQRCCQDRAPQPSTRNGKNAMGELPPAKRAKQGKLES